MDETSYSHEGLVKVGSEFKASNKEEYDILKN
jgi:hypothetical protein